MTTTPKRIALFIFSSESPYQVGLLRGVVDHAAAVHDWSVRVDSFADIVGEDVCPGAEIDGILASLGNMKNPLAGRILTANIPAINIYPDIGDVPIPHVLPDDVAVGRAAARALVERGFRHCAFMGFPGQVFSDRRALGFAETLGAQGRGVTEYVPGELWWNPTGHPAELERMRAWLLELPKPVGIFAATDSLGRRVIGLCQEIGLRVPESVAVLGVDNVEPLCEIMRPGLSSIPLDGRGAGLAACAALDRLLAGEAASLVPTLMPPLPLVERRSTDVFAVDDENVGLAMRYIWENAHREMDVAAILEAVPASRRNLERRFKKAMGRTLLDEIWRVRVEKAKKLLAGTNWAMPRIAKDSGFPSAKGLSAIFLRETGMTPTGYRAKYHLGQRRP